MALGNYRQAARTAVLIARQELELGNYKVIVGPHKSIAVCNLAKDSPHHGTFNLYHVRFITLGSPNRCATYMSLFSITAYDISI